jgi:hypothetical protein
MKKRTIPVCRYVTYPVPEKSAEMKKGFDSGRTLLVC